MKPINFIAPFLSASLSLKRWAYISSISIILSSLMLSVFSFFHYKEIHALKRMLHALEYEIEVQQKALHQTASSLKQSRGLALLYRKLTTKASLPHTILLSFAQVITEDMWLEKYTIRARKGSLEGYTKSASSLTLFIAYLLAEGHFKQITLHSLEQRSQGYFFFKLTIHISH